MYIYPKLIVKSHILNKYQIITIERKILEFNNKREPVK